MSPSRVREPSVGCSASVHGNDAPDSSLIDCVITGLPEGLRRGRRVIALRSVWHTALLRGVALSSARLQESLFVLPLFLLKFLSQIEFSLEVGLWEPAHFPIHEPSENRTVGPGATSRAKRGFLKATKHRINRLPEKPASDGDHSRAYRIDVRP